MYKQANESFITFNHSDDLPPNGADLSQAMLVLYEIWTMSYHTLHHIDYNSNTVFLGNHYDIKACVGMRVCSSVSLFLSLSLYIYIHVCVCLCVSIYICIFFFILNYMYNIKEQYIHTHLYIDTFIYIYMGAWEIDDHHKAK